MSTSTGRVRSLTAHYDPCVVSSLGSSSSAPSLDSSSSIFPAGCSSSNGSTQQQQTALAEKRKKSFNRISVTKIVAAKGEGNVRSLTDQFTAASAAVEGVATVKGRQALKQKQTQDTSVELVGAAIQTQTATEMAMRELVVALGSRER